MEICYENRVQLKAKQKPTHIAHPFKSSNPFASGYPL